MTQWRSIFAYATDFHLNDGHDSTYIKEMAANSTDVATDMAMKRGAEWLASCDVRPTRQRLSLAAVLVGDGQNRHVTAESLFAAVRASDEKVSLATVYNTLRAFCDAGLMREITVDGAKSYFDTNMDDHPHFYWEDTATLSDAPASDLVINRLPEAPEGAEIAKVDVVIRLRKTS